MGRDDVSLGHDVAFPCRTLKTLVLYVRGACVEGVCNGQIIQCMVRLYTSILYCNGSQSIPGDRGSKYCILANGKNLYPQKLYDLIM